MTLAADKNVEEGVWNLVFTKDHPRIYACTGRLMEDFLRIDPNLKLKVERPTLEHHIWF